MGEFRLSTATWKWLICVLTIVSAVMMVMESQHGLRAMVFRGSQGTLGASLDDHIGLYPQSHGTHVLHILALADGSPLLAYGARPGDRLRYDRTIDRWRRFEAGEPIGLTLYQGERRQHLNVSAVATTIPFVEIADFAGRMLMAIPALMFSFLIGIKQGEERAQRSLAMAFCALTLVMYIATNYLPAGPVLFTSKFAQLVTYPLIWYWVALFALNYQPYRDSALRRRLQCAFPPYRLMAFGVAGYAGWYGLGYEAPLLLALTGAVIVIGLSMTMLSMIEGWRQSRGEVRQRHQWLLLSFAIGTIPAMLAWIPAFDAGYRGMRWTILAMFVSQIIMYIGFAYAVLKHRIFNFDFAISRMLIFSVVSILLLCTFFALERISSILLHGDASHVPPLTLVLDGIAALGVYLVFHHVHGRVERKIERIFFHEWHENEKNLRQYLKSAPHVTTVDALLASFQVAVERFTAHAGCAIYLRQGDGVYALATGASLAQAPAQIDPDDSMALALRSELHAQRIEHARSALPGELALPMSHRGALDGFLLVGARRSGEAYRPDEAAVLSFAALQVGLDLHALRAELLESQVEQLAQQVEKQDSELALMAGRRRTASAMRGLAVE